MHIYATLQYHVTAVCTSFVGIDRARRTKILNDNRLHLDLAHTTLAPRSCPTYEMWSRPRQSSKARIANIFSSISREWRRIGHWSRAEQSRTNGPRTRYTECIAEIRQQFGRVKSSKYTCLRANDII